MSFNSEVLRAGASALIVSIVLVSSINRGWAADVGLSLLQAQRIAVERSRQLEAQDAAAMASRSMALAARQLPDPVLKLGLDNLPADGADRFNLSRDFMTQRRIGMSQEFPREEKRQLRFERFEREAERAEADRAASVAMVRRDTALAWLEHYYAGAAAALVGEQSAASRLELEAAESAYRAGRGSQADVFAARTALVMLDDRMSDVARRIRSAKAALARWVGEAAELALEGKPALDVIALDRSALEAQLAHHPQIAAMARQEAIADTEVRLAQANRTADWSVEVAYSQRGPAFANMLSFGVSIPLQWDRKNRQDRELASRLALVGQARAQREDALRAHVAEVRSLLSDWDSSRERHARYERELIPLAAQRSLALEAAYRGGRASLSDVLASRRNEIDVRLQALQLEADAAQSWARLNFLVPVAHSTATNPPANPIKEAK